MSKDQNQNSARPDVGSAFVKIVKPNSVKNLDLFIEKYGKTTYRMKDYVETTNGPVAVQTSFEHSQIKPVPQNPFHTKMVIIGPGIEQ
jgi:hypothetical protein